ncbi:MULTISPECIES: hypothetical protein [Paraburkholderia]|uniref:hypothetical protein n=1 Tax=Paraburkholderia TaxID=1822464 RepID=UPI00037B3295|nr:MULTISPECIES: hypothetical protein [Paraburkholderia]MDH6150516.1 hypothetical protein [Paraburkholderia sp. WSM4179]
MAPLATPWTADLVARRAIDFVRAQSAMRIARDEYCEGCARFWERHGLTCIDRDDPEFHRATRKTYRSLCAARNDLHNARCRLETAVRRPDSYLGADHG